ncbi:MAG: hypothetical protein E6K92_08215 [Thaumarchaeota archaeon]|nr:MAG: hypothetical protein E6K92_08215 [Nitrososphaerota archaeon]
MSNAAGNIMQILANLPVFLRKPMLLNRLKEFYAMSDNDKRETINMALSAASTIDPNKLSALFRTWLEILSEFDTEKRAIMFQTYCKQILENTRLIEKLDFRSLTATFLSLDQKQQERLTDSLQEVLFSFPNRYEILKQVPEDSLKAVGLK